MSRPEASRRMTLKKPVASAWAAPLSVAIHASTSALVASAG